MPAACHDPTACYNTVSQILSITSLLRSALSCGRSPLDVLQRWSRCCTRGSGAPPGNLPRQLPPARQLPAGPLHPALYHCRSARYKLLQQLLDQLLQRALRGQRWDGWGLEWELRAAPGEQGTPPGFPPREWRVPAGGWRRWTAAARGECATPCRRQQKLALIASALPAFSMARSIYLAFRMSAADAAFM